jgi:Tfp pilus assembly PilM family ATPase
MFSFSTKKVSVVVSISTNHISYVIVDKDSDGFFVVHYEEAVLPEGIIEKGEILKAEALTNILKKIRSTISEHVPSKRKVEYSLLLPHHYFRYEAIPLTLSPEEKNRKEYVQQFLKDNSDTYPWVTNHSYTFHYSQEAQELYISALNNDMYSSYRSVFQTAGYVDVNIESSTTACGILLNDQPLASLVLFGEDFSYLIGYRNGHRVSSQKFEISYQRFVSDIVRGLRIEPSVARKIISDYGVSRAHKDSKVYTQLMRSLTPLLDLLRKKKIVSKHPLHVWYLNTPIIAMEEVIEKRVGIEVKELHPLNIPTHNFHEVLTMHKDESYRYSLLLAYAMVNTQ